MNASLRFGFWYALHAMPAGFKLETGIGAKTFDAHNDLLVTTVFTQAFADDFQFPAVLFGIA